MKSNFQILRELAKVLSNQPTLNRKFLQHDGGNPKNRQNDIPRLCFFDDLLQERCVLSSSVSTLCQRRLVSYSKLSFTRRSKRARILGSVPNVPKHVLQTKN
uniref:Uncharacterized protein n=1 Tax=Cucumis melo TaxID=3656 RepID=A0A9I9E5E9_CUCME